MEQVQPQTKSRHSEADGPIRNTRTHLRARRRRAATRAAPLEEGSPYGGARTEEHLGSTTVLTQFTETTLENADGKLKGSPRQSRCVSPVSFLFSFLAFFFPQLPLAVACDFFPSRGLPTNALVIHLLRNCIYKRLLAPVFLRGPRRGRRGAPLHRLCRSTGKRDQHRHPAKMVRDVTAKTPPPPPPGVDMLCTSE